MKKILLSPINIWKIFFLILLVLGSVASFIGVKRVQNLQSQAGELQRKVYSQTRDQVILDAQKKDLSEQLASASSRIAVLEQEDQRLRNDTLTEEIKQIKMTFSKALTLYEDITDLKEGKGKGLAMDKTFSSILSDLSKEQYASASGKLEKLAKDIAVEQAKQAASGVSSNVAASNTPPGSGYSRQKVHIDSGDFVVDLVAGNLASTRVIVDTASESDCGNNCPMLPLASYVSRSGAFAGINGSYFCPESYPQCAGKTNSFDLLVMNKKKTYFNSDNNVYSQNPAAIFSGNSARFVAHAQDAGRDTGVDSVISNFPLLLINGQVQFGGNGDPKMGSRGTRAFIAAKGSTAYIGVVRGVTVAEGALVLKALGMDHAINLDSGGSIALWANGGYKAGPGRSIPNAVLFVRK